MLFKDTSLTAEFVVVEADEKMIMYD